MRIVLASVLLASPVLAGCMDGGDGFSPNALLGAGSLLAPPLDAALWNDPQQAPHPAFGWPTITHVPEGAPAFWQPIAARDVPADPTAIEKLAAAGEGGTGDGIAVFGRIAVNPSGEVLDISDPANPTVLSTIEIGLPARQAVLVPYPDGRLVAAFATGSGQIPLWDLSDPAAPHEITIIEAPNSGHTIAVVPGTPILYNANAAGSLPFFAFNPTGSKGAQTEIFDLGDPANPVLVQEWQNGYGCHAISFHIMAERSRAYCAAVDATQIWDITDPRAPQVVATAPMPHGVAAAPGFPILATVSHWAVVNADASVMAVADETGGGAAPMCDAYARAAGRTASGPWGNVWFYDVSDETAPELLGWVSPSSHLAYQQAFGSCTAHVGRMVPHAERDLLVMSFYSAGVALIDFTDPTSPWIAAHHVEGSHMDAWFYNGYLFAGRASAGVDVLTLA